MKALATKMCTRGASGRIGRSLAAAVLLVTAADAAASSVSADEAATADTSVNALALRDLVASHESASGVQVPLDSLLPLPSSYYGGNNPYVLFADTLALSPNVPQTRGTGSVYLYDANNDLPVPGPVPVPAPLFLLASGLAVLAAARRRRSGPMTTAA